MTPPVVCPADLMSEVRYPTACASATSSWLWMKTARFPSGIRDLNVAGSPLPRRPDRPILGKVIMWRIASADV